MALLRGGQARLGRARRAHVLQRRRSSWRSWRRSSCRRSSRTSPSAPSSRRDRDRPRRARGRGRPRVRLGSRSPAASARRSRSPCWSSSPSGSCTRASQPLTVAFWDCLVGTVAIAPALLVRDRVVPATRASGLRCCSSASSSPGFSTLVYAVLLRHVTAQAAGILTFLEPLAAVVPGLGRSSTSRWRRRRSSAGSRPRRRDRRRALEPAERVSARRLPGRIDWSREHRHDPTSPTGTSRSSWCA